MNQQSLTGGHRRAIRTTLVAALAIALILAHTPRPASAQVPGVPPLSELIEQIGDIEGLDPLDPILNPVADLIIEIENQLGDGALPTGVNSIALQGDDAVEASVAFSQLAFPDGANTAVLGRDDLFADGMSSSGFQGVFDAPLLLTDTSDLDRRTGLELQRLGMEALTILGGDDALHPLVVQKLEIAGLAVTRVDGPTRVETSVAAAQTTSPNATHALLVRAYPSAGGDDTSSDDTQAYADLLAAGPYASENDWPVLMTTSDQLHPAVRAQLADFDEVTIIGGTDAISGAVETELTGMGITVDRVAGDNRFATAVAIANARGFQSSADADQIVLAEQGGRDDVWAPGFSATAYADQVSAPVLLADGPLLPQETLEFLAAGLPDNLTDGGPGVVCAPFVSPLACQAAGLIVIGNISDAADILDIALEDLPLIGDILDALAEAGLLPDELQEVIDTLVAGGLSPEALTDLLEGLAGGDAEAITDALESVPGVGDLIGGDDDGDGDGEDSGNPVEDLIGDLIGGLG